MTLHQIAGTAPDERGETTKYGQLVRRRALVIVGMHRSGTSAFARVFNLLGAELPRTLMTPEDFRGNPSGFWEPLEVVNLHDELLREAGRTWHDFSPLSPAWFQSELVQSYESRLVELVGREYASAPFFVLKDPRISRLVPLWLRVFERLEVSPCFTIVLRNPLEVAASLKARDRFATAKSLLLWLRHILEVERETRAQPRMFVEYESLLRNWRAVSARLSEEHGIVWPRATHSAELQIERFLSDEHRHHRFTSQDLETRMDLPAWVNQAYAAVSTLTREPWENVSEILEAVSVEVDEADKSYGPLVAQWYGHAQHLTHELAQRDEELARREGVVQELEQAQAARDAVAVELEALRSELEQRAGELERAQAERATRIEELTRARSERDAHAEELRRAEAERRAGAEELARVVADRDGRAEELARVLAERDASAEELASTVAERDERAQELARAVTERAADAEELERLRAEQDAEATSREAEAEELRGTVAERDAELEERRARIAELEWLLGEREAKVEELTGLEAERSARVEELDRALAARQAEAEELAAVDAERRAKADELERALGERDATIEELRRVEAEQAARAAELEQAQVELHARADELAAAVAAREAELAERDHVLAEQADEVRMLRRVLRKVSEKRAVEQQRAERMRRELREHELKAAERAEEALRLAGHLETTTRDLEQLRDELYGRREEVARLSETLAMRQGMLDRSTAEVEERRRRVDDLAEELRAREQALAELGRESERLATQLAARDEALAGRGREVEELTARAGLLDEDLRKRVAEVAQRDRALADRRAEVGRLRGELRTTAAELHERSDRIAEFERRTERLAAELAGREETLAEREERLEVLSAAHQQAQDEMHTLRLGALAAEESIATLSVAVNELRQDARGLQALLEGDRVYTSRYRTLSQLGSWLVHGHFRLVLSYLKLRRSKDIHQASYAARYPDVARSGLNPVMHYIEHGLGEGRDATQWARREDELLYGGPRGELPEAVAAQLDAAISDHQPPAPQPVPAAVDEHARLLGRIRGVAERNIPAGAKVSVVTNGDADLLNIPGREGWHFPRTPGGAHRTGDPVDGAEVVSWLEQARRAGSTYLLVPSSSYWWLENYRGLADHLERRCRLIVKRDDACAIYALPPVTAPARPEADPARLEEAIAQSRTLVRSLLPAGATVVVLGGPKPPAEFEGVRTWRLEPASENGATLEQLDGFRAKGARYVFVPASELASFTQNRGLREHVERQYAVVARRDNVGVVFEATEPAKPPAQPPAKPATPSPAN